MTPSGKPDIGKLRWRCRRGTKELDVLTTRYLDHHYASASLEEQLAFAALLELQDPELYKILSRTQAVDNPVQAAIIAKVHST